MIPINIHTHHPGAEGYDSLLNCYPETFDPDYQGYCSVGMHPWYAGRQFNATSCDLLRQAAVCDNVLALGEAGLDKRCDTPFDVQLRAFEFQVSLACEVNKPMVLHVVKAVDEVLAVRRAAKAVRPWVLHGFRGNAQQAAQLLRHGLYLSVGMHFNVDALRCVPLDRLLIETDDACIDILSVAARVSAVLDLPQPQLLQQLRRNVQAVFFNS